MHTPTLVKLCDCPLLLRNFTVRIIEGKKNKKISPPTAKMIYVTCNLSMKKYFKGWSGNDEQEVDL